MKTFKIKITKRAESDVYYEVKAEDSEKARQIALDYAVAKSYRPEENIRIVGAPVVYPTTLTPVILS